MVSDSVFMAKGGNGRTKLARQNNRQPPGDDWQLSAVTTKQHVTLLNTTPRQNAAGTSRNDELPLTQRHNAAFTCKG